MSFLTSKFAVGKGKSKDEGLDYTPGSGTAVRVSEPSPLDWPLLYAFVALALFGLIMIGSSSMPYATRHYGEPLYFVVRQSIFLGVSVVFAFAAFSIPTRQLERWGPLLLICSLILLSLVLVPGIGKLVNGSRRWLALGPINVQVSEMVKLFIVIYLAGYLVRRGELVKSTWKGFFNPLVLVLVADLLLLAEPDFGATVVITVTAVVMLFIAGVRLQQFAVLIGLLGVLGSLVIVTSPYRLQRLASFLKPFDDPFGAGFQLTQSLIAIGSGSWSGVGIGSSVQKLFYLPEAHTDFVFAIMAEELGFIGVTAVLGLFAFIVWRCFLISKTAYSQGNYFSAYTALGIAVWIGLQSYINIGVNMGVLPTKGITLPLLSYGGSSAVIIVVSFAIILRIDFENRKMAREQLRPSRKQQVMRAGRVYV